MIDRIDSECPHEFCQRYLWSPSKGGLCADIVDRVLLGASVKGLLLIQGVQVADIEACVEDCCRQQYLVMSRATPAVQTIDQPYGIG